MVISASNQNAQASRLVLMMGGTFDPIHHGHCRSALELTQRLPVQRVHLVPCQQPVHRTTPGASPDQRMTMLRLAIADEPLLCADDRELRRSTPSWTVDTLESLRAEYGDQQPLGLVLGWDAFCGIPHWSRPERLLELAHLIVLTRPGSGGEPPALLQDWLTQHQTQALDDLLQQPAGRLWCDTLPSQLMISASHIRQQIAEGQSIRYLLPEAVANYIAQHSLYLP